MQLSLQLVGALLLVGGHACPAVRPQSSTTTTSTTSSSTATPVEVAKTTSSSSSSSSTSVAVVPSSSAAASSSASSEREPVSSTSAVISTTAAQTTTFATSIKVLSTTTTTIYTTSTLSAASSTFSSTTTSRVSTSSSTSSTTTSKLATSSASSSTSSSTTTSKPATSSAASSTTTSKPATSSASSSTSSSTTTSSTSTSSVPSTTSSATTPSSSVVVRTYPADVVDKLRDASMSKLEAYLKQNPPSNGCTLEKATVRREWTDLSVPEREEYIAAVKCLQSKPPKSTSSQVPGARSRFDDFIATHIQQTDSIHGTANFLTWHRMYVASYETALRDECGYRGAHPYWNWDRYAKDPANSPLFNGNSSSLSGNSVSGQCVSTGPFKDMKVNLGPGKSFKYNPRCLKRDISKSWAAATTADKSYSLITGNNDIGSFQNTMQAYSGVHPGGHFTIGGDPGGDIYTSPGDPAFYLHHAMIDRVWWIWQMQDLQTRLKAVTGSVAGTNRGGSVNDLVGLGVNGADVKLGTLLDTMSGPFCYIYA